MPPGGGPLELALGLESNDFEAGLARIAARLEALVRLSSEFAKHLSAGLARASSALADTAARATSNALDPLTAGIKNQREIVAEAVADSKRIQKYLQGRAVQAATEARALREKELADFRTFLRQQARARDEAEREALRTAGAAQAERSRAERAATQEGLETFRAAQRARAQTAAQTARESARAAIEAERERVRSENAATAEGLAGFRASQRSRAQIALDVERQQGEAVRLAAAERARAEKVANDEALATFRATQRSRAQIAQQAEDARLRAARAADQQREEMTRRASAAAEAIGSTFETQFTRRLQQGFSFLERGALRLASVLTGGGLETIIRETVDFERAIADVQSILPKGAADISVYRDAVLKLSKTTDKRLIDSVRGLYDAISSGADPALRAGGALDILTAAQRAATAGLADVKDTVRVGTTVFNTFGKSIGSAEQVFGKLFEAVNIGVFTFPELAKAIGRVSGQAATFGVSLDQMLGALATISKSGVNANESVTQLSRLITSIVRPTVSAQKAAKEFGITLGASALQGKDLLKFLKELQERVAAKGGNLNEAVSKIVGGRIEAFRAAIALLRQGGAEFEKDAGKISAGSGALARALEAQTNTVDYQLGVVQNRFRVLAAEVYQKASPTIIAALKDVAAAVETLNRNDLAAFLRDGLETLRQFVADLVTFRETAKQAYEAVRTFFIGGLLVGGFVAASRAVQTLVGALGVVGLAFGRVKVEAASAAAAIGTTAAASDRAAASGQRMGLVRFAGVIASAFALYEVIKLLSVAAAAAAEDLAKVATQQERLQRGKETGRVAAAVTEGAAFRTELAGEISGRAKERLDAGAKLSDARRREVEEEKRLLELEIEIERAALDEDLKISNDEARQRREALAKREEARDLLAGIIVSERDINRTEDVDFRKYLEGKRRAYLDEKAVLDIRVEAQRKAAEAFARQAGVGEVEPNTVDSLAAGLGRLIRDPQEIKAAEDKLRALQDALNQSAGAASLLDAKIKQLNQTLADDASRAVGTDVRAQEEELRRRGAKKRDQDEKEAANRTIGRAKEAKDRLAALAARYQREELQAGVEAREKELQAKRSDYDADRTLVQAHLDDLKFAEAKAAGARIQLAIFERDRRLAEIEQEFPRRKRSFEEQVLRLRAIEFAERQHAEKLAGIRADVDRARDQDDKKGRLKETQAAETAVQAIVDFYRRVAEVRRQQLQDPSRDVADVIQDVNPAEALGPLRDVATGYEEILVRARAVTKEFREIPKQGLLTSILSSEDIDRFGLKLTEVGNRIKALRRDVSQQEGRALNDAFTDFGRRVQQVRANLTSNFRSFQDVVENVAPLDALLRVSPRTFADLEMFKRELATLSEGGTVLPSLEDLDQLLARYDIPAKLREQIRSGLKRAAQDQEGGGLLDRLVTGLTVRARKNLSEAADEFGRAIRSAFTSPSANRSTTDAGETLVADKIESAGRVASGVIQSVVGALDSTDAALRGALDAATTVSGQIEDAEQAGADALSGAGDEAASFLQSGAKAATAVLQAGAALAGALFSAGVSLVVGKIVQAAQGLLDIAGNNSSASSQEDQKQFVNNIDRLAELEDQRADTAERLAIARQKVAELNGAGQGGTTEGRQAALQVRQLERQTRQQAGEQEATESDQERLAQEIEKGALQVAIEKQIDSVAQYVKNLLTNLPQTIFGVILGMVREVGLSIINALPAFITQLIGGLTNAILQTLPAIVEAFITAFVGHIDDIGFALAASVGRALEKIVERILNLINPFSDDPQVAAGIKRAEEGKLKKNETVTINLPDGRQFTISGRTGGFAAGMQRFANGGVVQEMRNSIGGAIGQRQQAMAQGLFAQLRDGAIPALLHANELVVPADQAGRVGALGAGMAIPFGAGTAAPTIVFQARNGVQALIAKAFSDMFVQQARREGADVRTARDVAAPGVPSTVPRLVPYRY